jgi:hypothetical protein
MNRTLVGLTRQSIISSQESSDEEGWTRGSSPRVTNPGMRQLTGLGLIIPAALLTS